MGEPDRRMLAYIAARAQLVGYAQSLLKAREPAEEVVQEAYIRLFSGRAEPAGESVSRAYLFRIVRNLAFDRLRRDRLERQSLDAPAPDWIDRRSHPSAEEAHLAREELGRVARLIAGLPEAQRQALEMYRFAEMPMEEIATRLGVSLRSAYRLVQAAMATLTLGLDDGEGPEHGSMNGPKNGPD